MRSCDVKSKTLDVPSIYRKVPKNTWETHSSRNNIEIFTSNT